LVPVHAEQPPNVILIFADDLGYGDVGCYGATKIQTPNIDRLAAEGRRFTDAHSASAVCTPSRYGLLTGQYPFRANGGKGLWRPTSFKTALLIDPDTLTIADVMKRRGYDTAVFGKWHLGFKKGNNDWQEPLRPGPQDLGFDYYFGMPVVNCAPPYAYVENDHFYGSDPNDPLIDVGRGNDNAHPVSVLPPEAGRRSPNRYKGVMENRFLHILPARKSTIRSPRPNSFKAPARPASTETLLTSSIGLLAKLEKHWKRLAKRITP